MDIGLLLRNLYLSDGLRLSKTRTAISGMVLLQKKYPDLKCLVVVPTDLLKGQWECQLKSFGIQNAEVFVINSAIKDKHTCDLLVCDEIHRYASTQFQQIFSLCTYKYIMGLTATLERLDMRHVLLEKVCPVCDVVTQEEALKNEWLADKIEYKVVITPEDYEEYAQANREFNRHFEFFGWDFNLAMAMFGPSGYKNKIKYRDWRCKLPQKPKPDPAAVLKEISYHAAGFQRSMQARKSYIYNHPKKIELTEAIISARPNSKIVTFSATSKVASTIKHGKLYTGGSSKKSNEQTLEEFKTAKYGVLNTVKKANEGMDIPGINCAIILGQDSSKTTFIQRLGRCIRKEGDKKAEIFTFVLAGTAEESWFKNSHEGQEYVCIDEDNLHKVLANQPYETIVDTSRTIFRF